MSWIDVKDFVRKSSWKISPKMSCAISYIHNRHKLPNFKKPRDLSEIILRDIYTEESIKYAPYADKVEVRKFYEEWGLGSYLLKLYGVWDKASEIDFDVLPNKFALKTNNYNGGHLFCHDKSRFDFKMALRHMDEQLKKVHPNIREKQYCGIVPKIYAEELLEDPERTQPLDYKFHCCDGRVNGCFLGVDRNDTYVKYTFYNIDWHKRDDFMKGSHRSDKEIPRPQHLEEMIQIAKTIAPKFEQVRVDLYDIGEKVYMGELTFTAEGGIMSFFTNKAVEYLGHRD